MINSQTANHHRLSELHITMLWPHRASIISHYPSLIGKDYLIIYLVDSKPWKIYITSKNKSHGFVPYSKHISYHRMYSRRVSNIHGIVGVFQILSYVDSNRKKCLTQWRETCRLYSYILYYVVYGQPHTKIQPTSYLMDRSHSEMVGGDIVPVKRWRG